MKLEKFDLEKALNGAKVVTRDGREVTQLTKFQGLGILRTLVGVFGGCMKTWCSNGTFRGGEEHILDLFLAVEPNKSYANVYLDTEYDFILIGEVFQSEKKAKEKGKSTSDSTLKYIKTIEITDEV
jgi:hypothetical protein